MDFQLRIFIQNETATFNKALKLIFSGTGNWVRSILLFRAGIEAFRARFPVPMRRAYAMYRLEEEMLLNPKDVGRKVRMRNGEVVRIDRFDQFLHCYYGTNVQSGKSTCISQIQVKEYVDEAFSTTQEENKP